MVGLPGSGKTTWLEREGKVGVSSDRLRAWLTGDETNQEVNRQVFRLMREMVRARAEAGAAETYVDATSLTRRERRAWVRLGELLDWEVEAVYCEAPLEECKRRNRQRGRVVPEEAMERMAGRMERPEEGEGFSRVVVVRG